MSAAPLVFRGATMSKYDDVRITQEIDDDGRRFVLSLDGKRIVANSMKECLKAMGLTHSLPDNCRGKTLDVNTARRRARCHRRKEQIASRVVHPVTTDDFRLFHCRFQELKVEPGSVHLILTDIPYGEAFLPELRDLGKFAARNLVEGGLFVSAIGKAYLPHCIAEFGRRLEWGWLCSTIWQGDSPHHHARNCVDRFTAWLVYSKGPWVRRGLWWDRFDSPHKEKNHHPWQKPVADVEHWLRRFSEPNDLVCDPCAGSFTTAVACALNNRRFIGCDCEAENVAVGQERIAEIVADKDSLVSQER